MKDIADLGLESEMERVCQFRVGGTGRSSRALHIGWVESTWVSSYGFHSNLSRRATREN